MACWIWAPFLSEAVEASWCYFFENWFMKLKFPNLLKPLGTIIQQNYWSFYPSETHFFLLIMKYFLFWIGFHSLLCSLLSSPHLKVLDFSEKTMTFYCPDGSAFKTTSSELGNRKKDCNVGSWNNKSCWARGDGCSAGGSLMNNQFLVILINLYSY